MKMKEKEIILYYATLFTNIIICLLSPESQIGIIDLGKQNTSLGNQIRNLGY